jgi:shikimate kinase
MVQDPNGILVLTGPLGAGKTTVAVEVGRQLEAKGISCGVIDLDWLGWIHPATCLHSVEELILKNLMAVWPNFSALGVNYLVLARALIGGGIVEALAARFAQADITVVRLHASPRTLRHRLRRRDSGGELREHLAELHDITAAMDKANLTSRVVVNDTLPVEQVALKVLGMIAWG